MLNPIYTQVYKTSIIPISSISNIQWLSTSSALQTSSPQKYNIQYQSLGEPSCSLVSYKTSSNVTTVIGLIGTSSATCVSIFPAYTSTITQLYIGDYSNISTSNNTLSFTTSKISTDGNNQLILNITNAQSYAIATTNVTFVSQLGLCNIPQVDILNKSTIFFQPINFIRSNMIVISSQTILNCSSGLANTKQW